MKRACLFLFSAVLSAKTSVWIDSDPSMAPGGHEIDDGFAWLQALHSNELNVRGLSLVFGNAPLDQGLSIAQHFLPLLTRSLQPTSGAAAATGLGRETDASRALAEELHNERLIILALGPLTNVATVLRNHPDLAPRILQIVAVAGRRPGQHFTTGNNSTRPFRDFNFEMDSAAFEVVLNSKVPLVLAPWEISSKVWLRSADLMRLEHGGPAARWLLDPAKDWLNFWKQSFGVDGFNPFDTLAVAYVTSPQFLKCEDLPAEIRVLPDDVQPKTTKPYLLVASEIKSHRTVKYCYEAKPEWKDDLMKRLLRK